MDCSLPGASLHGIFQTGILEWVTISYSRRSFRPRDQTHVSRNGRKILYHSASWEANKLVTWAPRLSVVTGKGSCSLGHGRLHGKAGSWLYRLCHLEGVSLQWCVAHYPRLGAVAWIKSCWGEKACGGALGSCIIQSWEWVKERDEAVWKSEAALPGPALPPFAAALVPLFKCGKRRGTGWSTQGASASTYGSSYLMATSYFGRMLGDIGARPL